MCKLSDRQELTIRKVAAQPSEPCLRKAVHFFLNWVKEGIDEMDVTLTPLKGKAAEMLADFRVKADQFIADLGKMLSEFESTSRSKPGGRQREATNARLETQWRGFEGKQIPEIGKDTRNSRLSWPNKPKYRSCERVFPNSIVGSNQVG